MKKTKLLFIIMIIIMIIAILPTKTQAVNQTKTNNISEIDENKYHGIKSKIQELQSKHPNWIFKVLYTGLDWNTVINAEAKHGRNLIGANLSQYSGDWICETCGGKGYSGGKWRCASAGAIAYMMDPRNSLDEGSVFQFLELSYDQNITYNPEVIKIILKDSFLDDGNLEQYINTIMNECKEKNVNPYYIAGKIIQEQGKNGGTTVKMNVDGQETIYYNIFNIRATGSTREEIVRNALEKAIAEDWSSVEKCLIGGIKFISEGYISVGQDTMYFEKFDVIANSFYSHQYAQDVLYAEHEGTKLKSALEKIGAKDLAYTFVIPIYENMPQDASARPDIVGTVPQANEVSQSETNQLVADGTQPQNDTTETAIDDSQLQSENDVANTELPENNAQEEVKPVKISNLKLSENIVTGIAEKTAENDFLQNINIHETLTVQLENTKDECITTGTKIVVKNKENGEVVFEYACLVYGDINKDGKISSSDYVLIKNHIMTDKKIEGISLQAADINCDGKVSSSDYVLIKNHIMNGTEIKNNSYLE